jgi:hypothetical protein
MFVFLAVLACGQRMDHGGSVGAYAYGDHRSGVPNWELDEELPHDKFTFARVIFTSTSSWSWRRIDRWTIDYPESDLNFSFRLQQMTAMKVDPDGVLLELTDPKLFDYPFIYMVEPGFLLFSEAEVKALRTYLLNGGFLMVDDFWGEDEWENFRLEIKRVFPEKEAIEITLDHEIFNTVFPLKKTLDKLPQIPNVGQAIQGRRQGITWERWDAQEPHYRIIKDDLDRIMVMICHNTDLGDGWEEEARNHWYFSEFSEKKAYPLGINIIFYAMTH